LNDLSKSLYFCFKEIQDIWQLRKERVELSQVKIQLEGCEKDNKHYAQYLDEKLEKFHWILVQACA
jgi:hypothetical protein